MWQPEVQQLLQCFHVCLAWDSENQEYVSTPVASLKDCYPEDGFYLLLMLLIEERKNVLFM